MASTAELEAEILADLEENPDAYTAPVNDIITIDPETKTINLPLSEVLFGTEEEQGVERKYFKCPRIVGDNIDLFTHQIYISYMAVRDENATFIPDSIPQSYWCDDVALDETGNYITFSWLLSGNVLASRGFVGFAVIAKSVEGDILKTRWKTAPAVGTVLMTVPDAGEGIAELYPDIITQLLDRMGSVEEIATVEAMQGYVDDYLGRNPVQLDSTLTDPEKAAPADVVGELRSDLDELHVEMEHEYLELITFSVNVGCFSKVGWNFYTDDWAKGYNYARLPVIQGDKYVVDCYGNGNAQAVMFFSGEPSQDTYISGLGETEQTYIDYEISVPELATVMLVQTMPHKTPISIEKNIKYTMPETIFGKMYWQVKDGELIVVSKYDKDIDLVVKFGKRGPNSLPDFKSFSIQNNSSLIPSSGESATEFIGNVTDWHSPFKIRAVSNANGDKGTNYNYTGGNHNYNNVSASGEGLATARCSTLIYIIDGVETTIGSGYSSNIKAKWINYVQANNTIKSDGTGREVIKEGHELSFDNGKFTSIGYIEPLEDVNILEYYGYQLYGLNLATAFNEGIRFIGATNRELFTDLSSGHDSGNKDCNGIEAVGTNNSCRLLIDCSYDLGRREFYTGTKGCFNTQYQKAYTNLISNQNGLKAGNRYYSRAVWEFYPTIN